ncbi:MAG TPA: MFS transporter [Gaiellaceae bacterium]
MRRLLLLVSAIMLVDTTFFTALTPLLPHYADTLGLSKLGAGVLTASFGAGTLLGAIPAGVLAARLGPKPVVLLGLGLLAATSLVFGFGASISILDGARFLQGAGGACTWTGSLAWLAAAAPSERRGEVIGTALGAGIGGALLGPAVGAAAASLGTRPVFGGVAVVGGAIAAAVVAFPAPRPSVPQRLSALRGRIGDAELLGGMWLVALAAMLFGSVSVLAPLRLDRLGFGAAAIGGAFLLSAALEATASPVLGRISDRRGTLPLTRVALAAATVVSLALPWPGNAWLLGALVVACGLAYGGFWVPGMAMLSFGAERTGLDQSFAFALMNLAWATGESAGSFAGGALGQHLGDVVPYWGGAALCLVTLAAAGLTRGRSPAYSEAR